MSGSLAASELSCKDDPINDIGDPLNRIEKDLSLVQTCDLEPRPKVTNTEKFCQNCVQGRNAILEIEKVPDRSKERFDGLILKNQGRIWNQALDRLITDIAFLNAEGVVNSKLANGLQASSCTIDSIESNMQKLGTAGCANGVSAEEVKGRLAKVFNLKGDYSSSVKEMAETLKNKADDALTDFVDPKKADDLQSCLPKQLFYQYQIASSTNKTNKFVTGLLEMKKTFGEAIFDRIGKDPKLSPLESIIANIESYNKADVSQDEKDKAIKYLSNSIKLLEFNNSPDVAKVSYLLQKGDTLKQFLGRVNYSAAKTAKEIEQSISEALNHDSVITSLSVGINRQCQNRLDKSLEKIACTKNIPVSEDEYKDILEEVNGKGSSWRKVERNLVNDVVLDTLFCEKQLASSNDDKTLYKSLLSRAGYEQKVYADHGLIYQDKKLEEFNKEMCPILRDCSEKECKIKNPSDLLSNTAEFAKLNEKQQKYIRELAEIAKSLPKDGSSQGVIIGGTDFPSKNKDKMNSLASNFVKGDKKKGALTLSAFGENNSEATNDQAQGKEEKAQNIEEQSSQVAGLGDSSYSTSVQSISSVSSSSNGGESIQKKTYHSSSGPSSYTPSFSSPSRGSSSGVRSASKWQNNGAVDDSYDDGVKDLQQSADELRREINQLKAANANVSVASAAPTSAKTFSESALSSSGSGSGRSPSSAGGGYAQVAPGGSSSSAGGGSVAAGGSGRGMGLNSEKLGEEILLSKKDEEKQTLKNVDLSKVEDLTSKGFLDGVKKWMKDKELLNDVFFLDAPILVNNSPIKVKMQVIKNNMNGEVVRVAPATDNGNLAVLDKLVALAESDDLKSSEKVELVEFVEKIMALI